MTTGTPTTKQLTKDDLELISSEMLQRYEEVMNRVEKEHDSGNLSQSQFNEAVGELQKLEIK